MLSVAGARPLQSQALNDEDSFDAQDGAGLALWVPTEGTEFGRLLHTFDQVALHLLTLFAGLFEGVAWLLHHGRGPAGFPWHGGAV